MANVKRIKRRRTKRIGVDDLYYAQKAKEQVIRQKNENLYKCYFDGACTVNPGGAMGVGSLVLHNGERKEMMRAFADDDCNSNNVAEYMALIQVLNYLFDRVDKNSVVIIYGDSKLVVNQMNGRWKIKSGMYDFYAEHALKMFNELKQNVHKLRINWIGREQNEEADFLSKKALEQIWEV